MPPYEVAVIIKRLSGQQQLKKALKGACEGIFRHGGLISKMENLGQRELPHPKKANDGKVHYLGNYFAIQFDTSVEGKERTETDFRNMNDIIHFGVIRKDPEPRRPCLDGPCLFGELPNPEHEKTAYKRKVLKQLKNRHISNV